MSAMRTGCMKGVSPSAVQPLRACTCAHSRPWTPHQPPAPAQRQALYCLRLGLRQYGGSRGSVCGRGRLRRAARLMGQVRVRWVIEGHAVY